MSKYLLEPILNSELVLVNNAKKLKENPDLLNEKYLDEIEEIREKLYELEQSTEKKLQKVKRELRDRLRDISYVTYTNRDTNLFGYMITQIADKIITRPQFNNYTFKDEMKSLGIQYVLLYTHKFDPYRQSEITGQYASAFAYISTIMFNAYIATINKHHKEQEKAKEDFMETRKLIHRDPNCSTIGPDFEDAKRRIQLPNLDMQENSLLKIMKSTTINEATEFWIPENYKISNKEMDFVMKYVHNISIRRIKS